MANDKKTWTSFYRSSLEPLALIGVGLALTPITAVRHSRFVADVRDDPKLVLDYLKVGFWSAIGLPVLMVRWLLQPLIHPHANASERNDGVYF